MSGCIGACCSSFYLNPEDVKILRTTPHLRTDGEMIAKMIISLGDDQYTCKHFDGQFCSIYEQRPAMCRDFPYGKPCFAEKHGCVFRSLADRECVGGNPQMNADRRKLVRDLVGMVRALQLKLEVLSAEFTTDALTGLSTTRALEGRSTKGSWFVLADLDNFKRAQDATGHGHMWGDAILQEFARFLLRNTRSSSTIVMRRSGDEFLVVAESKIAARAIRDRIRQWRSGNITASAGIGLDEASADAAMYLDKRRKKDAQQCA